MKLAGGRVDGFLDKPDDGVAAVLIYGPDQGLARERADRVMRAVAGSTDDPFRTVTLEEQDLSDDADRLAAERAALAFGGGRRAIRISGGDRCLAALEKAVDAAGDGLVVVIAGDLNPRSKLRQFGEKCPAVAVIACYADDDRAVQQVIQQSLAADGLSVSREALAYLTANLGSDRLVSRRELEKLALYMAGSGVREVSLADAEACVGDNGAHSLDQVTQAVAAGDLTALHKAFAEALDMGESPVGILRAAQRLMQRLHLAATQVAAGRSAEQVVDGLRPPVFFKEKPVLTRALKAWTVRRLGSALEVLTEAERACKSGQGPDLVICERALMRLARLAG